MSSRTRRKIRCPECGVVISLLWSGKIYPHKRCEFDPGKIYVEPGEEIPQELLLVTG